MVNDVLGFSGYNNLIIKWERAEEFMRALLFLLAA